MGKDKITKTIEEESIEIENDNKSETIDQKFADSNYTKALLRGSSNKTLNQLNEHSGIILTSPFDGSSISSNNTINQKGAKGNEAKLIGKNTKNTINQGYGGDNVEISDGTWNSINQGDGNDRTDILDRAVMDPQKDIAYNVVNQGRGNDVLFLGNTKYAHNNIFDGGEGQDTIILESGKLSGYKLSVDNSGQLNITDKSGNTNHFKNYETLIADDFLDIQKLTEILNKYGVKKGNEHSMDSKALMTAYNKEIAKEQNHK